MLNPSGTPCFCFVLLVFLGGFLMWVFLNLVSQTVMRLCWKCMCGSADQKHQRPVETSNTSCWRTVTLNSLTDIYSRGVDSRSLVVFFRGWPTENCTGLIFIFQCFCKDNTRHLWFLVTCRSRFFVFSMKMLNSKSWKSASRWAVI